MKRLTRALIALCACSTWFAGARAQDAGTREAALFGYEQPAEGAEAGFWWMRRRDEATLQFSNWTRVNASSRPQGITGSMNGKVMEQLTRPFFIGDAIANLRGLDPTFGSRTLALTNGSVPPAPARPPVTPSREAVNVMEALAKLVPQNIERYMPQLPGIQDDSPPPEPVGLPDDVWLLKRDGTIIRPLRKTAVAEDQRYCAGGACEASYVYGFPLSAANEAMAVAFSRNGVVSTRKLASLAGLQQ